MLDINLILFFLLYLIVCLAFTVIYTKDSIIAIISLVLIYTLTAILLIIVGCEFLGILLIIVYVGAISILFLFIIIMLNLRVIEERNIIQNYIGVTLVILSNCILVIYLSVDESF
jgi:NADH-quinone oxidoreductase subunit J